MAMDSDLPWGELFSEPDSNFMVADSQPCDSQPCDLDPQNMFSHLKALSEPRTSMKNLASMSNLGTGVAESSHVPCDPTHGATMNISKNHVQVRSSMTGGSSGRGDPPSHAGSSGGGQGDDHQGSDMGDHGDSNHGDNPGGNSGAGGDGNGNRGNNDDEVQDEEEEDEEHQESAPSSGHSSGSMPELVPPPSGNGTVLLPHPDTEPPGGVSVDLIVSERSSGNNGVHDTSDGGISDAPTAVVSDTESLAVQPWLSPRPGPIHSPVDSTGAGERQGHTSHPSLRSPASAATYSPVRSGTSPRGELSSALSALSSFTSSSSSGAEITTPVIGSRKRVVTRRLPAPPAKKRRANTSSETDTTTDGRTTSTTTTTTTTTDTDAHSPPPHDPSHDPSHDTSDDQSEGHSCHEPHGHGDDKPEDTEAGGEGADVPCSQNDMFEDKDEVGCTPSETVGSLSLSAQPMLIPDALDRESVTVVPPSQDVFDVAPHIEPCSPSAPQSQEQMEPSSSSNSSSSMRPTTVPFQQWQPSFASVSTADQSKTSSASTSTSSVTSEGRTTMQRGNSALKRRDLPAFEEPPMSEDFNGVSVARSPAASARQHDPFLASQSLHLQFSDSQQPESMEPVDDDITVFVEPTKPAPPMETVGKVHEANQSEGSESCPASVQFVCETSQKEGVTQVIEVDEESSQSLALHMTLTQDTQVTGTQGQGEEMTMETNQSGVSGYSKDIYPQTGNSVGSPAERESPGGFCLSIPHDSDLLPKDPPPLSGQTETTAVDDVPKQTSHTSGPRLTLDMIHIEARDEEDEQPPATFTLDRPSVETQQYSEQSEVNVFNKVRDIHAQQLVNKALKRLQPSAKDSESMDPVVAEEMEFPESRSKQHPVDSGPTSTPGETPARQAELHASGDVIMEDSEVVIVRRKSKPIDEEEEEGDLVTEVKQTAATEDAVHGSEDKTSTLSQESPSMTQEYDYTSIRLDTAVPVVEERTIKQLKQTDSVKVKGSDKKTSTPDDVMKSPAGASLQRKLPHKDTPRSSRSKKRRRPTHPSTQPARPPSSKNRDAERDTASEPALAQYEFSSQSQDDKGALKTVLALGREARSRVSRSDEKSGGQKAAPAQSSASSSVRAAVSSTSDRGDVSMGNGGNWGQKSSGGSSGGHRSGIHTLRVTKVITTYRQTMTIVEEQVDGKTVRTEFSEDKLETLSRTMDTSEEILSPPSPSRSIQTMTTGDLADISSISHGSSKPGSSFNSPRSSLGGLMQHNTNLLMAQLQHSGTMHRGVNASLVTSNSTPPSLQTSLSDPGSGKFMTPLQKAPEHVLGQDGVRMPPPASASLNVSSSTLPQQLLRSSTLENAVPIQQTAGVRGESTESHKPLLKQKSSTSTVHSESLFSTTTESSTAKLLGRQSTDSLKQSASLFSNADSDSEKDSTISKSLPGLVSAQVNPAEVPDQSDNEDDSENVIPGTDCERPGGVKGLSSFRHGDGPTVTEETHNDEDGRISPELPVAGEDYDSFTRIQVAPPALSGDSVLETGTMVMAMWKDKHYYPATIVTKKRQRYQVMFEDKNEFLVKAQQLIVCDMVPVGQDVLVENENSWCQPGQVLAHLANEDGSKHYVIRVEAQLKITVSRSKVNLNAKQAADLIKAIKAGDYEKPTCSTKELGQEPVAPAGSVADDGGLGETKEAEAAEEDGSYLPDDPYVPLQPVALGTLVLARWRDNHLYPGKVTDTEGKDKKWTVSFDDGSVHLVSSHCVVVCDLLPIDSMVMAEREGGWSEAARVVSHFRRGQGAHLQYSYQVEFNDGTQQRLCRQGVTLSAEQASLLFSKLKSHLGTPLHTGLAIVSLENLVDGKRRRGTPTSSSKPPTSSSKPPTSSSKPPISLSTSTTRDTVKATTGKSVKRKLDPTTTSTPKRLLSSECKTPRTPILTPFASPTSERRSPRAARTSLFSNLKGPIPPTGSRLFHDKVFLLTHVEKTQEQKRLEKKLLRLHKGCISMETSEEDNCLDDEDEMPFDKDHLCAQLIAGGGTVLDKFDFNQLKSGKCFLISDSYQRTLKYFYCLAASIPCVSHVWVRDCCNANDLQDSKNYLLPAGISLESNKLVEWHARGGVLSKINIYLGSTNDKFITAWTGVLQVAGCTLKHTLPKTGAGVDVVLTDLYARQDDLDLADHLGIPVLSSEWIIQSLISGRRLDYHSHPKFKIDPAELKT